jgi:predicted ATPase
MPVSVFQPVRCPILVGRAAQPAMLREAREAAATGGTMVLVSGEAGVGKSRLVADALAVDAREVWTILRAACFESDQAAPCVPLIDVLRSLHPPMAVEQMRESLGPLTRDLVTLLPELADPRAATAPLATDPEQQRRLFHALALLLFRIAAGAPLAFVIEDLHWADEATLTFLRYLAHRIAPHPILLIGEGTVATHVGNILGKLGCTSRAQIATWAVERGLHTSR